MCFVVTKVASEIYGVDRKSIQKSAERNSRKYNYNYIDGFRGGNRGKILIIEVECEKLKAKVEGGEISEDIDIWIEGKKMRYRDIAKPPLREIYEDEPKPIKLKPLDIIGVIESLEDKRKLTNAKDRHKMIDLYLHLNSTNSTNVPEFIKLMNSQRVKISEHQLYRWKKQYEKEGIKGLSDNRGKVNAQKNLKTDLELVKLALTSASEARTYESAYYAYKMLYAQKYNLDFEENVISYDTFIRQSKSVLESDRKIYLLYTKGKSKVQDESTFSGISKRVARNEQWQVDATKLDLMVVKDGVIKRPMVITFIDKFSSRRIWYFADTANSYADVRALKEALLKFGKPKLVKGDNGADYLSEHFQRALKELGIHYIKARKFKGKDKGNVERNFGVIQHSSEFQYLVGYVGSNVAERDLLENMEVSKAEKLSGVKTHIKGLMEYEEAKDMVLAILHKKERELGWLDKWNSSKTEINYLDETVIEYALGKRKDKKIYKEGINHNGVIYWNDRFVKMMHEYVEIAEDIDDISNIHIFQNDVYLCTAKNRELLNITVEKARELEKESLKEINKLIKSADIARKYNQEFNRQELLKEKAKIKKEVITKEKRTVEVANIEEFEKKQVNNTVDDLARLLAEQSSNF